MLTSSQFQVVPRAALVLATGAIIEASDVVIPEGFSAPARPAAADADAEEAALSD